MNSGRISMLVLGVCLSAFAAAELVDGVVATVDTEVILHSDLMSEAGPLLMEMRSQAVSDAAFQQDMERVLVETLDQAIEQRVLYREALLANVQIDDGAIEDRIKRIKAQYDSEEAFLQALEEAGETMSDLRDRLLKQYIAISMGMHKRREFEEDVVISEAQMRQYYQDHSGEFTHPARVRVHRIFLTAPKDDAGRQAVAARLEALREELELGADFADLAKSYSEGPAADEGGLVGWVERGDLVADLEAAVFALEAGSISGIVETEYGYHLLKVSERQEAGSPPYEEVRTEIEPILRAEAADEYYQRWLKDLRKRSRVRVFL